MIFECLFSVRPMNGREMESNPNSEAILHCEGESSIIVCSWLLFRKKTELTRSDRLKDNITVGLHSMPFSTNNRHKTKCFITVESNV